MPSIYSTPEAVDRKRSGGVENAINVMGNALDELEEQVAALTQELTTVCRPTPPTCCEKEADCDVQSPLKVVLNMNVRRIKNIRDAVASIRSTLDL